MKEKDYQVHVIMFNNNTAIIQFKGVVDNLIYEDVEEQVPNLIHEGVKYIVFDFSDALISTTSILGSLCNALKLTKDSNGTIILAGASSKCKEVFKLLGFYRFFIVKDTVDEAIEYLKIGK